MKFLSFFNCSMVCVFWLMLFTNANAERFSGGTRISPQANAVHRDNAEASTKSDNNYQQAKTIFPNGDQDYCYEGTYRAGKNDKWLALVSRGEQWELQNAVVNKFGKVESQSGKAAFFLKNDNFPFTLGAVTNSPIKQLKTNNARRTEAAFVFNGINYSWVQWGWGGKSFFLTDGRSQWSSMNWPGPESKSLEIIKVEIPDQYKTNLSSDDNGSDYEDGSYAITWAGDINGDGFLDFIVAYQVKESWGHHLWVGSSLSNGELQFNLIASARDGCS